MKTETVKLSQIALNSANPRTINKDKFEKLVNSILALPKMLDLRPIVVDNTMVALGGNMRYRALSAIAEMSDEELKERLSGIRDFQKKTQAEQDNLVEYWLRWKDKPTAPVIKASELTDAEQREFIIKDNVGFGEWDMDALAKEVNEDLNAVDKTFGDDDTLLDDKLKEAAKTLQDGQVYGEVVEGENAYFVVRMDSVLDREATDAEKENIVSERQQNAYNDLLNQWKDDADITVNNREWDKVTLTDNEQYTIKQPETEDTTEDSSTDAGETTENSTDTQAE